MTTIRFAVLPTRSVKPDPKNIREDLGDLDELAASLRVHGMQQPVIVNASGPNTFRLVDGARRHAAALRAGLPGIPALIAPAKSRGGTVATMLAAAMHKQLHPIEQARAFAELQDDGMTVAEICRSTGYSRATVLTRLGLLELPEEAQAMVGRDEITLTQATALVRQVRASGGGTASTKSTTRSTWLAKSHPLAKTVAAACTHTADRTSVGGVGCGQCWEDSIRADERAAAQRPALSAVAG